MKKILSYLIMTVIVLSVFLPTSIVHAEKTEDSITEIIEGIISWKKSDLGANDSIFTDGMLSLAGSTAGDWYPIAMGRYGYKDNYTSYLAVLTENINNRYATRGKLHSAKATEWHRISLAMLSIGGNPRSIGNIDLIADGTYNRGYTASVGKQGINGWIWALIALDSKRYDVPSDAYNTREDFIVEILRLQLRDGGFALSGDISDPDITAMAIQALSPYYNSETVYEYKCSKNSSYQKKTVHQVIDESIEYLSSVQCPDGDFSSWGTVNVESTAQVLIALNSLGIDALNDKRFIKNGNTLLDGILKYRLQNGGFIHSFTFDVNNPNANPDKANSMASEQVLLALVSLWRNQNKMRTLYDMRDEFSAIEREKIDNCISAINNLNENSNKEDINEAVQKYISIPALDRCYITNYWYLSTLAKKAGIALPNDNASYDGGEGKEENPILYFSVSDREELDNLPSIENLTTEHYATVLKLRYILLNCEDFDDKASCIMKIDKAYYSIEEIREEINSVKDEIKEKLYPFDSITLADRKTVHALYERYMALSEYDRTQFDSADIEGLLKSKTKVDNLFSALCISLVSVIVAALITIGVVLHIKKRRKEKALKFMPESDE